MSIRGLHKSREGTGGCKAWKYELGWWPDASRAVTLLPVPVCASTTILSCGTLPKSSLPNIFIKNMAESKPDASSAPGATSTCSSQSCEFLINWPFFDTSNFLKYSYGVIGPVGEALRALLALRVPTCLKLTSPVPVASREFPTIVPILFIYESYFIVFSQQKLILSYFYVPATAGQPAPEWL